MSTTTVSSNYTTVNVNSAIKTNNQNVTSTKNIKINSTMAAGAPVKVNGLTVAQLKDGTSRIQSFYNKNGRLPKYVTFGTRKIIMSTFQKNIATQGLKINTKKVNGLTVAQLKDGTSRVQSFYNKNGRLPKYVTFGTRKIIMSTFQKNIATQGLKINTKKVNGLTVAQLKDGTSRVQSFYNKNGRLPKYVTFGTRKIIMSTFQKNIATQGLKINTVAAYGVSASQGVPVYITSDNIISKTSDNARINSIINGLKALGIKAYNMGVGPNYHISVLQSSKVPKNALVIDIYGGACAGTLKEMGSSWYKTIKGTRNVFSVFWPPSTDITNLAFLPRAHDDNFSPASFKGIAHPDDYLKANGYSYIHSGSMTDIVNAIFYQATH